MNSSNDECPLCKGTGFVRAEATRPPAKELDGTEVEGHKTGVVPCPHVVERLAKKRTILTYGEEYKPGATLDDLDGRLRDHALDFVQAWPERKGLVLCGDVGVGKSWAASAIVNELLKSHCKAMTFATVMPMLDDLRAVQVDDGKLSEMRRAIEQVELLVLDDLGAEKYTEWAEAQLYRIMSARHGKGAHTIVTSNRSWAKLLEHAGQRTMDRILGQAGGRPKLVEGPSRRWTR